MHFVCEIMYSQARGTYLSSEYTWICFQMNQWEQKDDVLVFQRSIEYIERGNFKHSKQEEIYRVPDIPISALV